MPDEVEAAPGSTEGADVASPGDDERNEQGAREQGVSSEESEDLSSPQFTRTRGQSG
jgi:hypothetical protein